MVGWLGRCQPSQMPCLCVKVVPILQKVNKRHHPLQFQLLFIWDWIGEGLKIDFRIIIDYK